MLTARYPSLCFVLESCEHQAGRLECLCECLVQQKALLVTEGSAIIKIHNILQCTLLPRPIYQNLLSVFLGTRLDCRLGFKITHEAPICCHMGCICVRVAQCVNIYWHRRACVVSAKQGKISGHITACFISVDVPHVLDIST